MRFEVDYYSEDDTSNHLRTWRKYRSLVLPFPLSVELDRCSIAEIVLLAVPIADIAESLLLGRGPRAHDDVGAVDPSIDRYVPFELEILIHLLNPLLQVIDQVVQIPSSFLKILNAVLMAPTHDILEDIACGVGIVSL